jgi:hypothetical protein
VSGVTRFTRPPYQKSFEPPDLAEPVYVVVLDDVADEPSAVLVEPGERIVEVVHANMTRR